MTRSDGLNKALEEPALPKSNSTGQNMDRLSGLLSNMTSSDDSACFHRDQSWSDVRRSVDTCKSTSRMNSTESDISILNRTTHRENSNESDITILTSDSRHSGSKRTSIESDISILTSDSSSITVIPNSSPENQQTLEVLQTQKKIPDQLVTPPVSNLPLGIAAPSSGKLLKGISEEGEVTPMGSPLSTSVCSSMVSSVYENSLTVNSNENLDMDKDLVVNDVKIAGNEDSQNNNDDAHTSIYDVESNSIYDGVSTTNQDSHVNVDEEITSEKNILNSSVVHQRETLIVPNPCDSLDDPINDNATAI